MNRHAFDDWHLLPALLVGSNQERDDDTAEAELEPGTGTDPEARTSRDLFEAPEEGR